jgi:hypothetical protein
MMRQQNRNAGVQEKRKHEQQEALELKMKLRGEIHRILGSNVLPEVSKNRHIT